MDDEDTGMADELEQQQQQQQQKQQEGMPATLEETQQQAVQQQAYVSQSAQQAQQHGVVGVGVPRPAPTYSVQTTICEKRDDGPGPRCGHTLTAVAAVGEEGSPNYVGPRLILFGGATALEGNSAAAGPQAAASAGAGISMCFFYFETRLLILEELRTQLGLMIKLTRTTTAQKLDHGHLSQLGFMCL